MLKVPGLRVLNLNQSPDVLAEALPFFSDAAVQLPIPSPWPGSGDATPPLDGVPAIFSVPVDTEDDAKRVVEAFRREWGG
jgi:hypothetical protein